jgi:hypothetical protein
MWHAWERKVYKVMVENPEGKRPLGRPMGRWENGIKMDLRMIDWEGVEWIRLGPVAGFCEHGGEPLVSGAADLV